MCTSTGSISTTGESSCADRVRPGGGGWICANLPAISLPTTRRGPGVTIERIVYCTARISARDNPIGESEQDVYLRALRRGGSVDHIEYGNYVTRTSRAPLATSGKRNRPVITTPGGPVMAKNAAGRDEPDARFIVSVARREEKGSDVNVAAHLLLDVLGGPQDGNPLMPPS